MKRAERLRKLRSGLSAQKGASMLNAANKKGASKTISTGVFQQDVALDGGIPIGHCTMAIGQESVGKSTNLYRVIGQAQSLCSNCYRPVDIESVENVGTEEDPFYVANATCDCYQLGLVKPKPWPEEIAQNGKLKNAEGTRTKLFDQRLERYEENSYEEFRCVLLDVEGTYIPDWGEKLGIDNRRLFYEMPTSGEEAADIYEDLIRTGDVDLVMLDSIAAMVPMEEVDEDSSADNHVGDQAKLVNKMIRKFTGACNEMRRKYGKEITHLWINQYRYKVGVMFGDPRTLPGGRGQQFYPSVKIEYSMKDKEHVQRDLDTTKKEGIEDMKAATTVFKIIKNKVTGRSGKGSFRAFYAGEDAGQPDELKFIEQLARRFGIIDKDGRNWICGNEEFNTKSELLNWLYKNPSEMRLLKQQIMSNLKGV